MKTLSLFLFLFVSQAALAIEAGKYTGVATTGGTCTFTINSIHFIDNVNDPINQRFDFQMGALKSTMTMTILLELWLQPA